MEIVHADWERRNMGVSCDEVSFNDMDTVEDGLRALAELDADYTVVRVTPYRPEWAFALAERGYVFVETMVHIAHSLTDLPALTGVQRALYDELVCAPMDTDDLIELDAMLRRGIFSTDRVSRDPYFTATQASNRFVGWVHDEVEGGGVPHKLVFDGLNVAFFLNKDRGGGRWITLLNGIYPDRGFTGLGFFLNYRQLEDAIAGGARRMDAYVSSNTPKGMRVQLSVGYQLQDMSYVYVKHRRSDGGDSPE